MKKSMKIVPIAIVASLIIFSSCNRKGCTDPKATNYSLKAKKDDGSCTYNGTSPSGQSPSTPNQPTDNTNTETFSSLASFISDNAPKSEHFSFNVAAGGIFTAKNGSVITIAPHSFTTKSRTAITGKIDLTVKEVYSNSEMMFSGVFPISYGRILSSGGEIFVQASQNGEQLIVDEGSMINVKIPAQEVGKKMELFLAGPEEVQDTVNWVRVDSSKTLSGFNFQSSDNTYELRLDSLGWGNIDQFLSNIQYFDCTFKLTGIENLNSENTTAFAIFKDENTVWPVGRKYWGDIKNNTITENHLANIPLNLIVISVVDKKLHYGLLDITPEKNKEYSIEMKEITSSDLDKIIENLP